MARIGVSLWSVMVICGLATVGLGSTETARMHSPCGVYPEAMWSSTPFDPAALYSSNSSIIVLGSDFELHPLGSIPNGTSPSLLLLDLAVIRTVWNYGRLGGVVDYYYSTGEYVGVLVRDVGISPGVFNQFPWQALDVHYPVGLIGYNHWTLFSQESCKGNITFLSVNHTGNSWKDVVDSGGYAVLHTIAVILFSINWALAVLRLKDMLNQKSIGTICLIAEALANTLYVTRYATNIAYAYLNYYNPALISTSELLSTVPVPFFLTASLLFVFFWLDVTSSSSYLYDGKLLGAMKIPSIVCITLVYILELVSDTLHFTLKSVSTSMVETIVGICYGVVLISIIVLNSLALYKVKRHESFKETHNRRMESIHSKVIFNIVILVIICILALVGSSSVGEIVGYYVRRVLVFITASLQSMNQIIVFRTKIHSSSSSTSPKKTQSGQSQQPNVLCP